MVVQKQIDEKDAVRANQELLRMQEKIRQSQLTVYQKDSLMQRLRSIRNAAHA